MHTYRTRTSLSARRLAPPALVRTSALRRVQFTRTGKRTARRICLPEHDVYTLYFTTSRNGAVTYHLDNMSGERRVFPTYDTVPDHRFVEP